MADALDGQQMINVAPCFSVGDVIASAEYYRDVLGFSFERLYGDPPGFTIVQRDGARVMLSQVTGAAPQSPRRPDSSDAGFLIADADALAAEFTARGAEIVQPPITRQIYNGREFSVRDCDGRILMFSQLFD